MPKCCDFKMSASRDKVTLEKLDPSMRATKPESVGMGLCMHECVCAFVLWSDTAVKVTPLVDRHHSGTRDDCTAYNWIIFMDVCVCVCVPHDCVCICYQTQRVWKSERSMQCGECRGCPVGRALCASYQPNSGVYIATGGAESHEGGQCTHINTTMSEGSCRGKGCYHVPCVRFFPMK